MIKQIILCFVVAIAMTVAGYYLCQSEAFKLYYCTLVFVTTFGATIVTCAVWFDLPSTLEGLKEDSKKEVIGDSIAMTVLDWLLPISIFFIGFLK